MRIGLNHKILLALTLLLGQWLTLAHNFEHAPQSTTQAADCVYCVHFAGLDAAVAAEQPQLNFELFAETAALQTVENVVSAHLRNYLIRGPPLLIS